MSKKKDELSPIEKAVIAFVVNALYEVAKNEIKRRLKQRKVRHV